MGYKIILVGSRLLYFAVPKVLLGWLHWKRGMLVAMVTHFGADIVIHVIRAFFVK